MERIAFEIVIDFEQAQASDVHYEELKSQVKEGLTSKLPIQKGTAQAQVVSISEK